MVQYCNQIQDMVYPNQTLVISHKLSQITGVRTIDSQEILFTKGLPGISGET